MLVLVVGGVTSLNGTWSAGRLLAFAAMSFVAMAWETKNGRCLGTMRSKRIRWRATPEIFWQDR